MSARDELHGHIYGAFDALDDPTEKRDTPSIITDALLAAGYSKPRTITLWGASFVHNGAFYKEYPTKEAAQAFVDEMGEVGAHLVVVTREHTPAVYSEWVTA